MSHELGIDPPVAATPEPATKRQPAEKTRTHVWIRFLLRRTARMIISLFIIVTVAFFVVRMSGGDPVREALGPTAPLALVEQRRAELGLDAPLLNQYLQYLLGLLQGDLGSSFITGQSVSSVVAERLPKTLALGFIAVVVVLIVAIPLGLIVAVMTQNGRRRLTEFSFGGITGLFLSIPEYLLAVGLVVLFGIMWPVLPIAGSDSAASYVLPIIALGAASSALIARIARVEGLKVLGQDYMRTARSKRLPKTTLYFKHALPNMLTAVLTLGGTTLGGLVAATALVEQVFNWPGLGYTLIQSISARDYNVVVGVAIVYATLIILINLLVDVLLAALDRRTALVEM
ncbi:ABC transporter permease [Paenarthrobacter sp. NPDC089714]|uniref:ABC transporter permease n=1 Tax=Paenarthrobacter sp. NPDC089714 TaxID=3364377 RepID=UPI003821C6AD